MTKCYLRRKSINSTTLYNTTSTINDHMQKLLSHPIISTKRKIYSWCFASCLCGTRFHVFKGDIRVNFSTITCQSDLNFFLKKKKKKLSIHRSITIISNNRCIYFKSYCIRDYYPVGIIKERMHGRVSKVV